MSKRASPTLIGAFVVGAWRSWSSVWWCSGA